MSSYQKSMPRLSAITIRPPALPAQPAPAAAAARASSSSADVTERISSALVAAAAARGSCADVTARTISSALVVAAIAVTAATATPCAALAAASQALPSPSSTQTSFASTPYTDLSDSIDYGLLDGRIRPCPGAIPNCVSTSSTTDLYAPALRAESTTPAQAAELLDAAVAASLKGEKIFQGAASRGAGLEGIFLQYEVPGASGRVRGPAGQPTKDVLEILLRPEGKEGIDTIATFRSVADPDSIRFLPLLQQPLTDGGAQKARMRGLLVERLGWTAIGCDTLDCFME